MNFNKLKYAAIAAATLAAVACDEKDADERYTYVPPVTAERSVLIEDFTGQSCINCPKATDEIHQLQEEYGDKVVAVGIHSGRFSKKPPRYTNPYSLWTSDGDTYYNYWAISDQPKGIINRKGGEQVYQNWAGLVANDLQQKSNVSIEVDNDYNANSNTLTIHTKLTAMPETTVDGKLQLWVIQDGITGAQYQPDGSIKKDYVHNHVFRFAANGTWGEDVSLAGGNVKTADLSINLNDKLAELRAENSGSPDFDAANMWVVAFVYNNYGVMNVAKTPLIKKQTEQ